MKKKNENLNKNIIEEDIDILNEEVDIKATNTYKDEELYINYKEHVTNTDFEKIFNDVKKQRKEKIEEHQKKRDLVKEKSEEANKRIESVLKGDYTEKFKKINIIEENTNKKDLQNIYDTSHIKNNNEQLKKEETFLDEVNFNKEEPLKNDIEETKHINKNINSTDQFNIIKSLIEKEKNFNNLKNKKNTNNNLSNENKTEDKEIEISPIKITEISDDANEYIKNEVEEKDKIEKLNKSDGILDKEDNKEIETTDDTSENTKGVVEEKDKETDKNNKLLDKEDNKETEIEPEKVTETTDDTSENTEDVIEEKNKETDKYNKLLGKENKERHKITEKINKQILKEANRDNKKNKKDLNFNKKLKEQSKIYHKAQWRNPININNGKFYDILRTECNDCVSKEINKSINKNEQDELLNFQNKEHKNIELIVTNKENDGFPNKKLREEAFKNNKTDDIVDYTRPDEAYSIKKELFRSKKILSLRILLLFILFFAVLLSNICMRLYVPGLSGLFKENQLINILINFIALVAGAFICKTTIINGVASLMRLKGNSDTAISFATIAGILQSFIAIFARDQFNEKGLAIYGLLVLFGLLLNSWGKFAVQKRVLNNFRFVCSSSKKYTAKIYTNEDQSEEMFKGLGNYRPIITYQKETEFLSNFLKLSYEPDPSEKFASKISIVAPIISVIIAIIYGIIAKDFLGGITSLTLCECITVPFCCLMAINIPIKKLCKKLIKQGSMLIGYSGIVQLSDTNAIVINCNDLYPAGSVGLRDIVTFTDQSIESIMVEVGLIIKKVESPLANIFEKFLKENENYLPVIEKVKYQDEMGIEGWVKGRRILVGNRMMMENHGIMPAPHKEEMQYKKRGIQITYIASANELIAMILTSYRPSNTLIYELQKLEDNGVNFLISTTDPNITSKLVSEQFKIFFKSVKILPTKLYDEFQKETKKPDKNTRSYCATVGSIRAFTSLISSCIRFRTNVNATIVMQAITVVLGLLLVTFLTFIGALSNMHTLEMFMYCVFWAIATLAIPYIRSI